MNVQPPNKSTHGLCVSAYDISFSNELSMRLSTPVQRSHALIGDWCYINTTFPMNSQRRRHVVTTSVTRVPTVLHDIITRPVSLLVSPSWRLFPSYAVVFFLPMASSSSSFLCRRDDFLVPRSDVPVCNNCCGTSIMIYRCVVSLPQWPWRSSCGHRDSFQFMLLTVVTCSLLVPLLRSPSWRTQLRKKLQ
jgi:hypothetical protein